MTRRWRESPATVLGVLTGLNALNYLDRYVGAATLPLMLASLSISDAAGGLLQSAFILTYALVCPFIGWAGDRGPRMRLAAAGVFLWSVATAPATPPARAPSRRSRSGPRCAPSSPGARGSPTPPRR